MMKKSARPHLVAEDVDPRQSPRGRLLAALRRNGPLARVDLGRATGMSPASVSALTAGLVAEGALVEEAEPQRDANPRGRPPVRLDFAVGRHCVGGVWVGLDRLEFALSDMRGRRIATRHERLPLRDLAAPALLDCIASRFDAFVADEAPALPVAGLGIALQGFVDAAQGTLIWSPVLSARDVPFATLMRERIGLPIDVENDAAAMAFAICRADPLLQIGRTACLMIGDGVGFALVADGELYKTARAGGSEFGHVRLDPTGPQCRCGARGCVESYLADYALYRDARMLVDLPPPRSGLEPSEPDMQALVACATNDTRLLRLFAGAGRMLARGAAMLIHILQPERLVICGAGMRARSLLREAFDRELDALTIPELRRLTQVDLVEHDSRLMTQGVMIRALERLDIALAGGSAPGT